MSYQQTQYISEKDIKEILEVTGSANSATLEEIRKNANREVDTKLKPYAEQIPQPQDDKDNLIFAQAQECAIAHARQLWAIENYQPNERIESFKNLYNEKIEALIKFIISEKPDRTQTVFITGKDPLEQIYQPYNVDEYLTRVF